jgi:hypothetical protein
MDFRAPIGISDFRTLRQSGATYVDKTRFVSEVLAIPAQALLFPRPRRFGKTLNLSTVRYFLERTDEDRSSLFEGLAVWEDAAARAHFGRHPVLFVTFKDVKYADWAQTHGKIAKLLADLFGEHRWLLDGGHLDEHEARRFRDVLALHAEPATLADGLRDLSTFLARATGEKVALLVDEYDTPIHAAYKNGFYDEGIEFFRNFLSAGFKDNPHLFKGVITGILRIAKESIFSGLNNLAVYSTLQSEFATDFGFTEPEVERLCDLADARDHLDDLRAWYDGYRFGGQVVYNPWSVLNFLASADRRYQPYWATTSANDLVRDLLVAGGLGTLADLETLLGGGVVEKPIDENLVLRDLDRRAEAVWSLLYFTGYLRGEGDDGGLRPRVRLSAPNREVASIFRDVFARWMEAGLGSGDRVREMTAALLAGDTASFGAALSELVRTSLSFHDFAGRHPERVFHAFVAGLLVFLEPDYEVRSNRESGFGRSDVLVIPTRRGRPGVVMELKSVGEEESADQALESALRQIRERDYASELRARGADPVHALAVAFDGKRVRVRAAR